MHVLIWATDGLDDGSIRTSKDMTDIVPQRLLSDNGSDVTVGFLKNCTLACHKRHTLRSVSKIVTGD